MHNLIGDRRFNFAKEIMKVLGAFSELLSVDVPSHCSCSGTVTEAIWRSVDHNSPNAGLHQC